ncbi:MAG: hypothetical protein ACLURP_02185 [Ruminococcus sp.]
MKRNRRIRKQQKKRCRREHKKRKKGGVAEIGSEVEELKRKLKEAKKSEKLEKRKNGSRSVSERILPDFKNARMCRKKNFGKKKTDYRRKKKNGKLSPGSMNRKQKNAASGKIWLCRQRKKL